MNLNARLPRWLTAIAMVVCGTAFAQTKEVTFAHQDMLVPLRTVTESGEIEKATGYKINWRQFESRRQGDPPRWPRATCRSA